MLRELGAALRRRRRALRVVGDSMSPTLAEGDVVWIDTSAKGCPEPGTLVVVRDPQHPERVLVKRARSRGDATFSVGSDNPTEGRDSRHFGSLREEHLIGTVVWTWRRGG